MNLIKSISAIVLLISIAGIMSAMQPVQEFNGPIKALFSSPTSIIATLPDDRQISLDPSIQWDVTNGILTRVKPLPTVQTTATAVIATQVIAQTPKPKTPAKASSLGAEILELFDGLGIPETPTTPASKVPSNQKTPTPKVGDQPPKIQCTDTTIEYDSKAFSMLQSYVFTNELLKVEPHWNGSQYAWRDNAIIKLPIDSKGLAFMLSLASKTDAQIFNFIDSLDDQTFRLVSFYTQLLKEERIANLLKYKMLKNPKLQQLAELTDDRIKGFIAGKYGRDWNNALQRQETLFNKYIDSNRNENYQYDSSKDVKIDSVYALLVLIDFYQETLKKPLSLDTGHLKNLFYAQSADTQQILLNKNLVILS
jgi:hypothetical protein